MNPINTLYISNLNDKIPINRLRNELFTVFSQYGTVVKVIAHKGPSKRGQAWICFQNSLAASKALNFLSSQTTETSDKSMLFGKPMRIEYAKREWIDPADMPYIPASQRLKEKAKPMNLKQQKERNEGGIDKTEQQSKHKKARLE